MLQKSLKGKDNLFENPVTKCKPDQTFHQKEHKSPNADPFEPFEKYVLF